MGDQPAQLPDAQVHALHEPRRRAGPTTWRTWTSRRAPGTQLDTTTLDQQGLLVGADHDLRPGRLQRVRAAADRPLRLRPERRARGRGHRGLRHAVRQRRLLPRRGPGRLQPHARAKTVVHDLHVGYQWYTDAEDLERSSNGWGSITVPGGRTSFQGRPIFYQTAFQQQTTGLVPVIHSEYQSQSFELNDTIRWRTLDVQRRRCWRATTRSTARACRRTPRRCPATCSPRATSTRCTSSGFGKMLQPRLGATWAYNGQRHGLRELRALQPGGELAAARRVLGSQPGDHHPRLLRRRRRAVRDRPGGLVLRQAVRRGHDAAPRRRVPARHGPPARPALVRAPVRPLPRGQPLLGGHEQRRPRALRAAAPASRASSTSPTSRSSGAQIGSGSSYVIAELDGAYTKYWEVTVETEWRAAKSFVRALVHLEQVLRQLRPGQLDGRQRRQHLHRLLEHRRRRRPPAVELQGRPPARRPSAPAEGLRHAPAALEARASASSSSFQSGQPWEAVELRAVPPVHHVDEREQPLRRAGGLAPLRLPLAAGPQLHAEHPPEGPAEPAARRGPVQRLRQADRLRHRAALPQLAVRPAAAVLRPAPAADRGAPASSSERRAHGTGARRASPGLSPASAASRRNRRSRAISGARRRVRLPAGERDARRAVRLAQQDAHLCALEERHRVAGMAGRHAVERRARVLEAALGEVEDTQLQVVAEGRACRRRARPRTPRSRAAVCSAPIASSPSRASSAAVGRPQRVNPLQQRQRVRRAALALAQPRQGLERGQAVRATRRATCSSSGTARGQSGPRA